MSNDDNLSSFLLDGNMQVLGGEMEGGNFAPASQVRSRFELQIQFLRFCSRTHHHCVFVLVSFRFESFSLLFVFFQRIFFISQPFLNGRFFLSFFFFVFEIRIRNLNKNSFQTDTVKSTTCDSTYRDHASSACSKHIQAIS